MLIFFFSEMASATGPSVAVIGGGIAGLVCANRLAQCGINNVTVYDTGKIILSYKKNKVS